MNEEIRSEGPAQVPQAEADLVALLKRIQQQLVFLEKKVDVLISQSQAAPSREKYFSKSPRPFDRSFRHGKGDRDGGRAQGGFDRGPRFEKRHPGEDRGYGHKKRRHDAPQESGPSHERRFEKHHGGENREFRHKKKPFFYGRKDRG